MSHGSPTIISYGELQRIRASVLPEVHRENPKAMRREELKAKCENRMKHWPNTLEALRNKKIAFVEEKANREEEARQEVDREEAERRRIQRLEAIKRANDLMYDQTDKMKGLKGSKLYADVMKTRSEQIERKANRVQEEKEWNKQFHVAILEKVAKGEAEEKAKNQKIAEKIEVIKVQRKEQVNEVRAKRASEIAEANAIGQAMKEQAIKRQEDDLVEQEAKQKRIDESNAAMVIANERAKQVRRELDEKAKEAEKIRDKEKEEVEGRKIAIKALEIRRFEKAQMTRQLIIDRAVKALAAKASADTALETKQFEEIKAKEDKVIADKAARREAEKLAIKESRAGQIARKKEQQEREWAEEDRMVVAQREKSALEERLEKEKYAKEHENIVRLKKIQYADAAKKQQKNAEEKLVNITQAKLLQDIGAQDDDKFAEICKAEIKKYAAEGKPVYTLMKALESTQPALLPAKLDSSKRGKGLEKD